MIASIIILVLIVFALSVHLIKHGEYRDGEYNFWVELVCCAIEITLYYFAGFFNKSTMNLPVLIILGVFMLINVFVHLIKHGESRDDKYIFFAALIGCAINLVLYYYAGLFNNF